MSIGKKKGFLISDHFKKFNELKKYSLYYGYLVDDVTFPEDKDWIAMHGVYNIEIHISEDEFKSIKEKNL